MGDSRNSKSAGAALVVAVLLGLFIVGGLVLFGAAAFFVVNTRTQAAKAMAQESQVRAAMAAAEARLRAAEAAKISPTFSGETGETIIRLDQDGNATMNDEAVQLGELKGRLERANQASAAPVPVVIGVHDNCLYKHVAAIQAICKEVGVENVHIVPLQEASGGD